MLNQLPSDEWPYIWILKNVVERVIEIFKRGLICRNRNAAQEGFSSDVVVSLHRPHRINEVRDTWRLDSLIRPTRKRSRKSRDRRLVVGWNILILSILDDGSVRVQTIEPDREELKNLACIVFIRSRLIVIRHVEIGTHGGVQCDVVHQLPEVSKCIAIQGLQIRSQPARVSLSDGVTIDDENLMQCERDALPQLIISVQCVCKESRLNWIQRVVVSPAN